MSLVPMFLLLSKFFGDYLYAVCVRYFLFGQQKSCESINFLAFIRNCCYNE